jgi:hypothetical protein
MMALEEKFDLQLDEEGEALLLIAAGGNAQTSRMVVGLHCTRSPMPYGRLCSFPACRSHTLMQLGGCAAGAEKISTVQEAADLISSQVSNA